MDRSSRAPPPPPLNLASPPAKLKLDRSNTADSYAASTPDSKVNTGNPNTNNHWCSLQISSLDIIKGKEKKKKKS